MYNNDYVDQSISYAVDKRTERVAKTKAKIAKFVGTKFETHLKPKDGFVGDFGHKLVSLITNGEMTTGNAPVDVVAPQTTTEVVEEVTTDENGKKKVNKQVKNVVLAHGGKSKTIEVKTSSTPSPWFNQIKFDRPWDELWLTCINDDMVRVFSISKDDAEMYRDQIFIENNHDCIHKPLKFFQERTEFKLEYESSIAV